MLTGMRWYRKLHCAVGNLRHTGNGGSGSRHHHNGKLREKTPILEREWVRPGTHIIAVGADMEGKQELDASLFHGAKIVVDNLSQCISRGETQNPLRQGLIRPGDIHCEIGRILLGQRPGRESDEEITIFDTTGMAVQDNVTAAKNLPGSSCTEARRVL